MSRASVSPTIRNRPLAFLSGMFCLGLVVYGVFTFHIELIAIGCLFLAWILLCVCFRSSWMLLIGLLIVILGYFAQTLVLYVNDPLSIQQRKHNMRTVIDAIHLYEKDHGQLPHFAIMDQQGRSLLSWRVMLLPYLGDSELYKEFRLDEPWNSTHNLKLFSRIPQVYRPVERLELNALTGRHIVKTITRPGFTHIVALRGPGSVFDSLSAVHSSNITGNILLFAEAGELIPWTKPEDITIDPSSPPPWLKAYQSGRGFTVLGCLDGNVVNCYEDEQESAFLNNSKLLLERVIYLPKSK